MADPSRTEDNKSALPQLRKNKHFRIKSASKEKLTAPSEVMSVKSRRKAIQGPKRIFSQTRNKNSGSIQTTVKIKIAREQLNKRFDKIGKETSRKKMIVYEGVQTENSSQPDDNRVTSRIKTISLDSNSNTLQKMARVCDPHRMANRDTEETKRVSFDENRFKKVKWDKESKESKESKQPKGKYRCRVNQYIFEKKKSNGKKGEQENYNQFWNNVNQSLILAGREEEEMSKDLKQFVCENFVTE